MAGMCTSMAWAWLGTGQAPSSTQRVWARKASLTRKATAEMTGFSSTRALKRASSLCALTIRFMLPWRYSMTSRERLAPHGPQHMAQGLGACGGVFDEFDAVQPQAIVHVGHGFAVRAKWGHSVLFGSQQPVQRPGAAVGRAMGRVCRHCWQGSWRKSGG